MHNKKILLFIFGLVAIAACALLADPFVLDPGTAISPMPIPVLVDTNGVVIAPTNSIDFKTNAVSFEQDATFLQSIILSGHLHVGAAIYVSPQGFVGTMNGNANGLTNIQLKISGTNSSAPSDTSTIKAWVNVTLPNGEVLKSPLYK